MEQPLHRDIVTEWARTNSMKEANLHSALNERVEEMLKSTNLLTFKRMLTSSGYTDSKVADLMYQGFPIVGALDGVDIFDLQHQKGRPRLVAQHCQVG